MYKTINGWTKEKMIKHIVNNFRGKSTDDPDISGYQVCRYRGTGGKKCAVGLFIPDEKYSDGIESVAVSEIYNDFKLVLPLSRTGMATFQLVHDDSIPSETLQVMLSWLIHNVK